jgi:hypothetical protein
LSDGDLGPDRGANWWGRVEWLVWWIEGDTPPPLVTTATPGTGIGTAGILGAATSRVLFGGSELNQDERNGARLTLGYWFDDHHSLGIEANYFMLEPTGSTFAANSGTTPILTRPFTSGTTALPDAAIVAFPGVAAGSVTASERSAVFHGGELLLRQHMSCGCFGLDVLYGYRYLHLGEELDVNQSTLVSGASAAPPLAGLAVGTGLQITDQFRTVNDLNALEIGLVAEAHGERLGISGFFKLAAGRGEESVSISGASTRILPTGAVTSVATGVLATGSNSGRWSKLEYPVVPDLGFEVSYRVRPGLRAFVGYEWMYWSRVLRPGEEVDTTINPALLPFAAPTAVVPRPLPFLEFKELVVQGLNAGVEFRY